MLLLHTLLRMHRRRQINLSQFPPIKPFHLVTSTTNTFNTLTFDNIILSLTFLTRISLHQFHQIILKVSLSMSDLSIVIELVLVQKLLP